MSRFKIFVIIASLFAIFAFFGARAHAQEVTTTTVEKKTIITPAPKSASCTTVKAHWEDNIWYDTQTICKYENRTEGVAWVQDYWACITATDTGECTAWEFKPGHWVKTFP